MRTYFQPLLISAAISSISVTTVWAISPDGSTGSRPAPSVSAPAAAPSSAPAPRSGGKPILTNPTVEDVKKALGIGQPKKRDIAKLKELTFGSFIEFETDSDVVIPSGGLEAILSALLDLEPHASIEIVGHTDNVGSASYNMDLSHRRAESVRRWLESRGVRPGAISRTRGVGLHEPRVSNATEAGRRENRRVEFTRIYE